MIIQTRKVQPKYFIKINAVFKSRAHSETTMMKLTTSNSKRTQLNNLTSD